MSNVYIQPQNNQPAEGGQNLRDQAADMARELKNKASGVSDTVTRVAKDTAKLEEAANQRKSLGASYIGSFAQAVERAAGEFDQDVPQAASYMRHASNQIQGFADAIEGRGVRELAGEVQDFARKQPTLFFGGAVILGFAALRFFKSGAPPSSPGLRVSRPSRDPGRDTLEQRNMG
jgi:hypothetical protein